MKWKQFKVQKNQSINII